MMAKHSLRIIFHLLVEKLLEQREGDRSQIFQEALWTSRKF